MGEDRRDTRAVGQGEVDTAGSTVQPAELRAGRAHRRGVDDRQQRLEVVDQHPVEERLVAVEQLHEEAVPREVAGLVAVEGERALALLLERLHARRQEAAKEKVVALAVAERGVLVQGGVASERCAV